MTVSISASVGQAHKGRTFARREQWIPDHDDGSTFTPGHWKAVDEEPVEISAGGLFDYAFGDGPGYSVTVWSEAAEDETAEEQAAT